MTHQYFLSIMRSITPQGVYPCINFSALPERVYIILPGLGRRRVRPKNQLLFHFHHFPNLQRYDSLASISRFAGIDIGSRTIELVVLNDRKTIESKQVDSAFCPMMREKEMFESVEHDHIMAEDHGRHLFEVSFDAPTILNQFQEQEE